MNKALWHNSTDAHAMLEWLFDEKPDFIGRNIEQFHRYVIACSWKHQHFIPQQKLREGLKGAEKWLDGEIDYEELHHLNWEAEAEAFFLDYATDPAEIEEIREMIARIPALDGMPFEAARELLKKAAYFAELSMIFSGLRPRPRAWKSSLMRSQLLCADLLRKFVQP